MKIVGHTEVVLGPYNKKKAYVCIITEDEIRNVANLSYGDKIDGKELAIGQDYPIDQGYNFLKEIKEATRSMESAMRNFSKGATTMAQFAKLLRKGD